MLIAYMKIEIISIISSIPAIIYAIFIFMIPNNSKNSGDDFIAKLILLLGVIFIFLIISVLISLIFGIN